MNLSETLTSAVHLTTEYTTPWNGLLKSTFAVNTARTSERVKDRDEYPGL